MAADLLDPSIDIISIQLNHTQSDGVLHLTMALAHNFVTSPTRNPFRALERVRQGPVPFFEAILHVTCTVPGI